MRRPTPRAVGLALGFCLAHASIAAYSVLAEDEPLPSELALFSAKVAVTVALVYGLDRLIYQPGQDSAGSAPASWRPRP